MITFNFQHLKTPPRYKKGVLVIMSDDGYRADYTHWFQLFQQKNKQYNSWAKNAVPFCPSVNTSRINKASGMTSDQLNEIQRSGGEILSHGHDHIGFLPHKVNSPLSSGTKSFKIADAGRIFGMPVEYVLSDGVNSEVVTIISRENVNSSTVGEIVLDKPIVNSYNESATVQATEFTMRNEWKVCIDLLASWGLNCNHHVWPYNQVGEPFKTLSKEYFTSASGEGNPPVNESKSVDFYDLNRRNITAMSNAQINDVLLNVASSGGVAIIYGHAETDAATLSKLEYAIDRCIELGIKIATISEAVNYLKS